MTHHVPFLDYEPMLARIDASIQAWDSRSVWCIDAPGGAGKTWLLREVHRRYRSDTVSSIIVTDILDFDDPTLHIPQNIGYRIAHMLDGKAFDPYFFVLHNWNKMGLSGANSPQLAQAVLALNQTFVNSYNMIAAQQRIVLLFDTLDALQEPDVFEYLLEVGKRLDNTVIVFSGRNTAQFGTSLKEVSIGKVEVIALPRLSEQASAEYLQRTTVQVAARLDPILQRKVIALAQGQPILLSLAVEWGANSPLPEWITASNPEALGANKEQQEEFARLLVQHVVTPATFVGQLSLLMARLAPVDGSIISALLNLSPTETQDLMKEMWSAPFVRQLPQGRLALHTEIERLVQAHVWPALDPDGEQRRQQSRLIADYLEYEVGTLIDTIGQKQVQVDADISITIPQRQTGPLMELQILEEQLWRCRGQLLTHRLIVDVDTGVQTFRELFATATRSYRLRFREKLFGYIEPYVAGLDPEQRMMVGSQRVVHLFDNRQYLSCKQLAALLLEQEAIGPEQSVELLIHMGNAEIRLGYLDQGVAHFERALRVCRVHGLRAGWVQALNARGWAYRNQGKHDQALLDYIEAYQRSLHLDDPQQTAWILNNISFVSALRGDRQAAFEACQSALNLWTAIGAQRGKGASYSTLGGIYVRFNEPVEAIAAYNMALGIFARERDMDWMSLVRCGRAYAFQVQKELDKAEEDLAWALMHGPVNLRARILYSQGLVAWDRGNLALAKQRLDECRALSQEIGDLFHDFKAFADLIELAWEAGEFERWQQFSHELDQLYGEREGLDAIRLRGSCLRKIGDLAICHGDYDAALAFYEEGFPILAEHEIHERYAIRSQMRKTDSRIRGRVPGKILSRLGIALAQFWRSNTALVLKYPEALLTFHHWEQEGEAVDQSIHPVA